MEESISDRARKSQEHGRNGPLCGVRSALLAMEPAQKKELAEALDDFSIHATMIAKVLAEDGLQLSQGAIQRHRRGVCQCWKFDR